MEGETIRMGQAVTLVCESYGGNPLAAIVWYKNNQRIDLENWGDYYKLYNNDLLKSSKYFIPFSEMR